METIKLGEAWYRRVGMSTLEHDHWVLGHARQAGAEGWQLRPGESHEEFGGRILADIMASGKAFLILGGLLMPSDEETWTPEMARVTASRLGRLTDPDEKRIANTELLTVVIEFFANGLAYWMTSGMSSGEGGKPAPTGGATSGGNGAASSG